MRRSTCNRAVWNGCVMGLLLGVCALRAQTLNIALEQGKRALREERFVDAKVIFTRYTQDHPADLAGRVGLADAELGLHAYAAAEADYRRAVAAEPLLWAAHKNLVLVEAQLGRWEDFDGERAVLRAARQRGAAGVSKYDSDVIDVLHVRGAGKEPKQRWIVREYFEPLGRAQARFNFERFSADGRVAAYVSLESANAFALETRGEDVVVGAGARPAYGADGCALDWYDGKAHGTIATYAGEPTYEAVRADFLRWARRRR